MAQLLATATGSTRDSAALIDHFFRNLLFDNPDYGILDAFLTDHYVTSGKLPFSFKLNENTETSYEAFSFIYGESAGQFYLEIFSNEMKMPNLYDDFDDHFEFFPESIQNSIELCTCVKRFRKRKCKPPWFHNEVKVGLSKMKQTLKRFRGIAAAWNKKMCLKTSRKTSFTGEEAKSNNFLICLLKLCEWAQKGLTDV